MSADGESGLVSETVEHTPLALVTPDTPVIALLTDGTAPENRQQCEKVESRDAPVIGVASDPGVPSHVDTTFDIPECGPLEPVVANVALQLFAYYVADAKDRPIDKPRNLAKSVTVE